ncbi:hypothetical protein T10_10461 [Trichinella papuae]|uniref:Uncharacterized protein n=1 Tax=Trichinella papuae TaxID=268474 RepID=A0A0V1MM52_9BILA|nr:hypothetical protein T10_10461 [Trichinella papuae]
MKLQALKRQLRTGMIRFETRISDIRQFCTDSDVSKVRSCMNELERTYADMSRLQREIKEFLTEENDMSEIEGWHKIEGAMLEIRCLAEETLNRRAENTTQSLPGAVRNATKSLRTKMKAKRPTSGKKEKRASYLWVRVTPGDGLVRAKFSPRSLTGH